MWDKRKDEKKAEKMKKKNYEIAEYATLTCRFNFKLN